MNQISHSKRYDLEQRTMNFAKSIISFVNKVPKLDSNREIIRQVVRSSGSVGANYIEANESISKKDFVFRVKICRKEAKESYYWLNLLIFRPDQEAERTCLMNESLELTKIFAAICNRC